MSYPDKSSSATLTVRTWATPRKCSRMQKENQSHAAQSQSERYDRQRTRIGDSQVISGGTEMGQGSDGSNTDDRQEVHEEQDPEHVQSRSPLAQYADAPPG